MQSNIVLKFGGVVPLEPFRIEREQQERLREERLEFSHHINPMREMYDVATIEAFVSVRRNMTDEQMRAFAKTWNQVLEDFRYRFESNYREEIAKAESSVDRQRD